jgi:hypothetical protein
MIFVFKHNHRKHLNITGRFQFQIFSNHQGAGTTFITLKIIEYKSFAETKPNGCPVHTTLSIAEPKQIPSLRRPSI